MHKLRNVYYVKGWRILTQAYALILMLCISNDEYY